MNAHAVLNTENLLKCISSRLSSRTELSKCKYVVTITEQRTVSMTPLVYVYPNTHRRHDSDKLDIVTYAMAGLSGDLVPGKYIYQSSTANRRRWTRSE